MKRARLSELPEAVRGFLTDALQDDGLILEDDLGRPRASLVPLETEPANKNGRPAQLPQWPGAVTSPLHRDELYAEV